MKEKLSRWKKSKDKLNILYYPPPLLSTSKKHRQDINSKEKMKQASKSHLSAKNEKICEKQNSG